ncbi:MAG: MFS transporter, partial [Caldithrix sp.]|nr:MFS transporter [Caldithrix sp.]
TMLSIGLAAGIFKPLVSGTIRSVTDSSNKTLGFGIFYAMVNVGASFGPVIAGKLRAISWNYAFIAAAISIGLMLLITIFFYKEPERKTEGITLGQKFKDMYVVLSDLKFVIFLVVIGLAFWLPFWSFFNLAAIYVDRNLDTVQLYLSVKAVLGTGVANFLSQTTAEGTRKLLGETISHTGYIIMILQIFVSRTAEKFKALPTFSFGLFLSAVGFIVMALAKLSAPALVFLGIAFFAVGEMTASPRIQEYITWIAPKEQAGLYMGANFLAVALGAFLSGVTYTSLYGYVRSLGHPEFVWYALAANMLLGILATFIFTKLVGEFTELQE